MFEKVDEFQCDGRAYTLYAGGSWTLFREEDDGASGIGSITRSDDGYAVNCWGHPGPSPTAPSLREAVEELLALDAG